ncbi:MAG: InlB B-repeat-containing protein, partial [Acholeplasmataceae bacterium]|nr:InlB B-repeat-containing protein [Acholeplasmataceae bacterium]
MFSKSLFRKIISYTFLVLTVSLLFLLASCVTPIDDNPREEVMVRFIVDGVVVKSETIPFRSDATAPEDPVKENYVFIGWDKSFTDVRSNLDVHALFKPVEYTITKTANVKVTVVRDNRTIVLNSGDTVAKGETITVSVVLTDSQVFDSLLINGVAYENNVSIEVTEDLSIEGKIKHKDGLTTKELLDQDIIQIGTYLGEQTADFDLPAAGQNGSVITWEVLSGSSIVLNGNRAIVTRPSDENETVVLLAHFELEDEYEDVEIVVIVLKEETATPNIYATDLFISEYAEGNA